MTTPKPITKGTKLIREAMDEVDEERGKTVKKELKALYKRKADAQDILTNIEREIEIKEAEILRDFNGS